MSFRASCSSALVVGVLLAAAVCAETPLAGKSPFLPTGDSAGAAAPTADAPLEFRGTMVTSEGIKLRIVEPARKNGAWLLVNERDPSLDFVVKQYDAEHDTVKVEYQGQMLTLAQHVAKVASAGAPQYPVPGPPGGVMAMPPSIAQSVVVNPTPADEQRRLDAVAAEVARRRALREQAAQQVSQGLPLAPQVIQQQQEQMRVQQQARQAQTQNPVGQNAGGRNQKVKNRQP